MEEQVCVRKRSVKWQTVGGLRPLIPAAVDAVALALALALVCFSFPFSLSFSFPSPFPSSFLFSCSFLTASASARSCSPSPRDVTKDAEAEEALEKLLCHDTLHVCCPPGRYGAKCKPCPGGADTPCNNHGRCKGEGTTEGSGKCACHNGYKGKTCNKCKKGFYPAPAEASDPDAGQAAPTCLKCASACTACTGSDLSTCTAVSW